MVTMLMVTMFTKFPFWIGIMHPAHAIDRRVCDIVQYHRQQSRRRGAICARLFASLKFVPAENKASLFWRILICVCTQVFTAVACLVHSHAQDRRPGAQQIPLNYRAKHTYKELVKFTCNKVPGSALEFSHLIKL